MAPVQAPEGVDGDRHEPGRAGTAAGGSSIPQVRGPRATGGPGGETAGPGGVCEPGPERAGEVRTTAVLESEDPGA